MPAGCAWSQFGSRYAASRLPAGAELGLEADRAQVRDQRRVAGGDVGADESDAIVAKDASVGERLQLVVAVEYLARKRIERLVPGWLGEFDHLVQAEVVSRPFAVADTNKKVAEPQLGSEQTPPLRSGLVSSSSAAAGSACHHSAKVEHRAAARTNLRSASTRRALARGSGDDRKAFAEGVSLPSRTDLHSDQVDPGLEEPSGRAQVVEDAVLAVLRRQGSREEEHV